MSRSASLLERRMPIVSTAEQSERLNEALPSSSLEILEGVGHMTHHARPDLVVLAVDRLTAQLHERGDGCSGGS